MHYTCDQCYKLKGPSYRECQADQQWTDTLPTCERKYVRKGLYCFPSECGRRRGGESLVSTSPRMQDVAVSAFSKLKLFPPGGRCSPPWSLTHSTTERVASYTYNKTAKTSYNRSAHKLVTSCLRTAYLNGTSLEELIFSLMALKHLLQGCFTKNGTAGLLVLSTTGVVSRLLGV